MRRFVLCLLSLLCIGCSDDIGTLSFDKTINTFSIFKPSIGTFKFEQSYEVTDGKSPKLTTSMLLEPNDFQILEYEILAFKGDTIRFSNMVMAARGVLVMTDLDFKEIDRTTAVLLKPNKVWIHVLSIDTEAPEKSGHYEGISKLTTPENEIQENTNELFSFFGSIDYTGRLLLFPTTKVSAFDYIEGQYNEQNEFTGKAMSNGAKVSDISNLAQNYVMEEGVLQDVFFLNIDSKLKTISLNIKKIAL
ncbi:MAG: hypothetical protein AAF489_15290 [Bacteroidota bacterium]